MNPERRRRSGVENTGSQVPNLASRVASGEATHEATSDARFGTSDPVFSTPEQAFDVRDS